MINFIAKNVQTGNILLENYKPKKMYAKTVELGVKNATIKTNATYVLIPNISH